MMSSTQISNVSLNPLTREQYSILQDVEGNGNATSVLCFGLGSKDRAMNRAMYEAIGKIPGADMLIAPRYDIQKNSFLFFFTTYDIKVKGKAIQIKTNL